MTGRIWEHVAEYRVVAMNVQALDAMKWVYLFSLLMNTRFYLKHFWLGASYKRVKGMMGDVDKVMLGICCSIPTRVRWRLLDGHSLT